MNKNKKENKAMAEKLKPISENFSGNAIIAHHKSIKAFKDLHDLETQFSSCETIMDKLRVVRDSMKYRTKAIYALEGVRRKFHEIDYSKDEEEKARLKEAAIEQHEQEIEQFELKL